MAGLRVVLELQPSSNLPGKHTPADGRWPRAHWKKCVLNSHGKSSVGQGRPGARSLNLFRRVCELRKRPCRMHSTSTFQLAGEAK